MARSSISRFLSENTVKAYHSALVSFALPQQRRPYQPSPNLTRHTSRVARFTSSLLNENPHKRRRKCLSTNSISSTLKIIQNISTSKNKCKSKTNNNSKTNLKPHQRPTSQIISEKKRKSWKQTLMMKLTGITCSWIKIQSPHQWPNNWIRQRVSSSICKKEVRAWLSRWQRAKPSSLIRPKNGSKSRV